MTPPTNRWTRLALALALLTCCVGCDQVTKQIATETLCGRPAQAYLANVVRLEYALNPGGFLSLGANLTPRLRFCVFTAMNVVLLGGAVYVLATRWDMHLVPFGAVVLLLAGGLGNLIDRVHQNGLVTDFLNLGIGPVRTGIFNVADVALTVGAVALLFTYRGVQATQQQTR
ncbi:MAG: signal peptidase II [Thermoguttaceae bacterium]